MAAYDFLSETLVGKQGPKGDTGDAGPSGGDAEFTFTDSTEWVIDHGLDYRPAVTVIDGQGRRVLAAVAYSGNDPQRIVVSHAEPTTGSVLLS